ncbi:MAG: hypothetical protein ABIA76_01015 [Candidatus Diapherotrites archaeon]
MADKSLFAEFFGDYPLIRVMDFLIECREFDYSKKDISRNADIAWNTLEGLWKHLKEEKIIVFTRKSGKADMYKLNMENPAVQKLIELDNNLMKKSMEKIEATAKPKTIAKEFA